MKEVIIPGSFGSGDLVIMINGVPTKVPIGKPSNVPDEVAEIVEKLIKEREQEVLSEEKLKEKERQLIGAAGADEVKNLEEEVGALKNSPLIKTLWTGCHFYGELTVKIPKEMFYNNGRSVIIIVQNWSRAAMKIYSDNRPMTMCFSFANEGDIGYSPYYANDESIIANAGLKEVQIVSGTGEGGNKFDGTWYMEEKNGERIMHIQGNASVIITAISAMKGAET